MKYLVSYLEKTYGTTVPISTEQYGTIIVNDPIDWLAERKKEDPSTECVILNVHYISNAQVKKYKGLFENASSN